MSQEKQLDRTSYFYCTLQSRSREPLMPVFASPFPSYEVHVLHPRNGATHSRHICPTLMDLIRIIPSWLSQEFVSHPTVILDLLNLTIEANHCSTKLVCVRGRSRNEIEGKQWEVVNMPNTFYNWKTFSLWNSILCTKII